MADLAEVVGAFGHLLHAAGVPVTPERSGRFARAVTLARPFEVDEVYWTGRVTLLSHHDHVEVYDRVFDQVFRGIADLAGSRGDTSAPPAAHTRPAPDQPRHRGGTSSEAPDARPGASGTPGGEGGEAEVVLAAASAEERLGRRSFASLTPDELASLRSLLVDLAILTPRRESRRHARHPSGDRLDLRATLRRAHHTAGDPVERIRRRHQVRRRRLVLIADVSGSMEPYTRAYLHLLHGAVRASRAEAFVFATRLTRLTRELAATHPDLALHRAAATAPDWSGGTRIGQALKAFNDGYGRRGMARGAVVVIVSDGWERDDARLLGEQMDRLGRLAHRIVWVNPRKAAGGYEPLAGGMAAALPYVDAFVSGHSLDALDEVLAAIGGVDDRRHGRP